MRTQAYASTLTLILAIGCTNDPVREVAVAQLDVLSTATSVSGHGNWINLQGEYVSRTLAPLPASSAIEGGNIQVKP